MESNVVSNIPLHSRYGRAGNAVIDKALTRAHGAVNAGAKFAHQTVLKAKPAIDRLADGAHQAVRNVACAVAPTARWLSRQRASLEATRQQLVGDARAQVSAKPLTAVALALAGGLLIGRFIR